MGPSSRVIERRRGRCGELVLRLGPGGYEVVCGGSFLISDANEVSSRAMIGAALPHLADRPLDLLVGGLGMGYALDEALSVDRVRGVTVAELEPVVVEWFGRYFGERAARAERDARSSIVVADVLDLLAGSPACYDLVALDTDNGPDWLVRGENARLYREGGLSCVASALRPGGVAVFWSPERYADFEERLRVGFARVLPVAAHDVVGERRFSYTMYVCLV